MRMPKVGDDVKVSFLDHESGDGEKPVARLIAHGRVFAVEPERIILDAWYDSEERLVGHGSLETFSIIRKCIQKIWVANSWRST